MGESNDILLTARGKAKSIAMIGGVGRPMEIIVSEKGEEENVRADCGRGSQENYGWRR